jgi:hypothetical protein
MRRLTTLCFALAACLAQAAPYTPKADNEVLERLPFKASAPEGQELRRLRRAFAEQPRDMQSALALARRYFDLASAEGDPRFVGYAEAAIRTWTASADPPVEILVMRALIRQYRHEFDPALADLARVAERDPENSQAWSWRSAILLVQADYAGARAACEKLVPIASVLLATACRTDVDGMTGKSRQAFTELSRALSRRPDASPDLNLWIQTRLAEMAQRQDKDELAERHFRQGLALGVVDGFILAAYADFLLDRNRPAEVVAMLKDWERSDVLLLRLALAEQASKHPAARAHIAMLKERFDASALRGDKLHLQEEARFHLYLLGDVPGALKLAEENYRTQREPRDARILFESALAAKNAAAAEPALDWLRASGYEDPLYARLAEQLKGLAR